MKTGQLLQWRAVHRGVPAETNNKSTNATRLEVLGIPDLWQETAVSIPEVTGTRSSPANPIWIVAIPSQTLKPSTLSGRCLAVSCNGGSPSGEARLNQPSFNGGGDCTCWWSIKRHCTFTRWGIKAENAPTAIPLITVSAGFLWSFACDAPCGNSFPSFLLDIRRSLCGAGGTPLGIVVSDVQVAVPTFPSVLHFLFVASQVRLPPTSMRGVAKRRRSSEGLRAARRARTSACSTCATS